jgi:hypothetical protein
MHQYNTCFHALCISATSKCEREQHVVKLDITRWLERCLRVSSFTNSSTGSSYSSSITSDTSTSLDVSA